MIKTETLENGTLIVTDERGEIHFIGDAQSMRELEESAKISANKLARYIDDCALQELAHK